jgi:hypothetical protein
MNNQKRDTNKCSHGNYLGCPATCSSCAWDAATPVREADQKRKKEAELIAEQAKLVAAAEIKRLEDAKYLPGVSPRVVKYLGVDADFPVTLMSWAEKHCNLIRVKMKSESEHCMAANLKAANGQDFDFGMPGVTEIVDERVWGTNWEIHFDEDVPANFNNEITAMQDRVGKNSGTNNGNKNSRMVSCKYLAWELLRRGTLIGIPKEAQ